MCVFFNRESFAPAAFDWANVFLRHILESASPRLSSSPNKRRRKPDLAHGPKAFPARCRHEIMVPRNYRRGFNRIYLILSVLWALWWVVIGAIYTPLSNAGNARLATYRFADQAYSSCQDDALTACGKSPDFISQTCIL
jgi:hypothetical protein